MTDRSTATDDTGPSTGRWSLLAVSGTVSLCCLFAAPTASSAAVVGGTAAAAGGTVAADGGLVRILVSALTVVFVGAVLRYRTGSAACAD